MEAEAKDYLSNLHINVPNDWLRECIQFVYEDTGDQARQPNWARVNILRLVYEQWLDTNLRELETSCLPPNLADIKKTVISGYFALQVNSFLDISQPAFQQFTKIEGVDRSNAEVTAEPVSQKKENSKRMLKLEMTDGVQTIHGMEYRTIPFLDASLPPGTKVLVFGTVECRRGMLLLTEENVKILGGQVENLGAASSQRGMLRRILNLPDNSNSTAESHQGMRHSVEAPNVPQTSVGQGMMSQGPQNWDDDEDDSIFLEDIENFNLNNSASQGATAMSDILRPPLRDINASIANQVDFNGFDDDDDAFQ